MKKASLLIMFIAALLTAFGHEYVLLASQYRLRMGDKLAIRLFVSDGFNIQAERTFQQAVTANFEMLTRDSTIDLTAQGNGSLPIASHSVNFEGGGLFHLERKYARVTLPTNKFLLYIKEDHIDGIVSRVNRYKAEQKERYTRYIKCLVQSGEDYRDTLYRKITGQKFEIVLLQNPYRLHVGSRIKAKIYFDGKPVTNKIITARNRTGSEPSIAVNSLTDMNGICSFVLGRKGEWFLHATHMIECADKMDSDWESFWASYSFELR